MITTAEKWKANAGRRSRTGRTRRRSRKRRNGPSPQFEVLEPRQLLSGAGFEPSLDSSNVIRVNSALDLSIPGDGFVTLREAITAANNDTTTDLGDTGSGADRILFDGLDGQTIVLTQGSLEITSDLEIIGPGAELLTIDSNFPSISIFTINNDDEMSNQNVGIHGMSLSGPANMMVSRENLTVTDVAMSSKNPTAGWSGLDQEFGTLIMTDSSVTGFKGRGIRLQNTEAILTRVDITGNTANTSAGGGIYADNTQLTIVDSQIQDNTAIGTFVGGGIYFSGANDLSTTSTLTMTNTIISGNSAARGGGAFIELADANLTNVTISDNTAQVHYGGGVYTYDARLNVTDSLIHNNSTNELYGGGGLYFEASSDSSPTPSLNVTDTEISGNSARWGGGIFIVSESPDMVATLTNVSVLENVVPALDPVEAIAGAVVVAGGGGGIYFSGASDLSTHSTLTMTNTIISGNSATSGGGAYIEFADANLTNVTISDNTAPVYVGGGLHTLDTRLNVTDSLIHNNSTNNELYGGGGLYFEASSDSLPTPSLNVTDTEISGNSAGRGGGIYIDSESPDMVATLRRTILEGNFASNNGGGIYQTDGELRIENSTLRDNLAVTGGGIYAELTGNASIHIEESILIENQATGSPRSSILPILWQDDTGPTASRGGGIYARVDGAASIHIEGSAFIGNKALGSGAPGGYGGGIYFISESEASLLSINNSTFSGNQTVFDGGALYIREGIAEISHSTIANNTIDPNEGTGNIWSGGLTTFATFAPTILRNTLISDNYKLNGQPALDLIALNPIHAEYSLLENVRPLEAKDIPTDTNLLGVDPMLEPLADNGGPSLTHMLLPGSPAIDAGANPMNLPYDQRGEGFSRTIGWATDIGAVEVQTPHPVTIDFDRDGDEKTLATGTVVDDEYAGAGLTISAISNRDPEAGNRAMIFDSANPTGEDDDLATPGYGPNNETPLSNVLIISEDGDSSDPDDDVHGGTFTFEWEGPVLVQSIGLLDVHTNGNNDSVIRLTRTNGAVVTVQIPKTTENEFQRLQLNVDQVVRMEVQFIQDGAITDLTYRRSSNSSPMASSSSTDNEESSMSGSSAAYYSLYWLLESTKDNDEKDDEADPVVDLLALL